MDAQQLDLCLSCGSHVADGSAHCSVRCQSMDYRKASPSYRLASSSSSTGSTSSRSRSYQQSASASSSSQHLPSYHSTYHSPLYCPDPKIASISEWAKGVWGSPADSTLLPSHSASPTTPTGPATKKPKSSSARSYTPPRFSLTPKHLAPPAMSIATTEDSASVTTPGSSVKSSSPSPSPVYARSEHFVDPWISSPPACQFVKGFAPATSLARGRQLVRA